MVNHEDVRQRFRSLSAFLDERMRRLVAAAESAAIGYGGVSVVARATGRNAPDGLGSLREAEAQALPRYRIHVSGGIADQQDAARGPRSGALPEGSRSAPRAQDLLPSQPRR